MKVSLSRPESKKVKSTLNTKKNSHTNSLIYKEINSQMEKIFAKSKHINPISREGTANSSKISKKNSAYIQNKKNPLPGKETIKAETKVQELSREGVNTIGRVSKELKEKKGGLGFNNCSNLSKRPSETMQSSLQKQQLSSLLKQPQILTNNFFMQRGSGQQIHAGLNSPVSNDQQNSQNEEDGEYDDFIHYSHNPSTKDLHQLKKSLNMMQPQEKRSSKRAIASQQQSPSMLKSISSQVPIKSRNNIEKSGRQTAIPSTSTNHSRGQPNNIKNTINSTVQAHGLSKKSYTKTKIKLEAKFFNNYKLERKLFTYDYIIGKGGFGKVWKVEHIKTRNQYAMKEMLKSIVITKKSVQSVLNERLLLSNLNSPFLVNMHYSFQDRDTLYLVLDLMQGGDLRYHIGNRTFSEIQSKFFVACIILGLEHMHSNNIIHRDIKPENLVLDSRGYIRITDLGIARILRPNNSSDTSGTPGYMSPQVICRQNHSFCSDYFALGVITHELMTGKRPYNGRTRNQIRDNMLAKQAQIKYSEIPQGWSAESADFINRLLIRKPENRLGFQSIEEIKNHPWVRMINWDKLYTKEIESPFIPMMKKKNFDQDEQITIEDEQQAQMIEKNSLLLRKPEFQQLFKEYFYDENQTILTAKEKNKKKSNPNITASVSYHQTALNSKSSKPSQNVSKKKILLEDSQEYRNGHVTSHNVSKVGGKKYSEQISGVSVCNKHSVIEIDSQNSYVNNCGVKRASHGTIEESRQNHQQIKEKRPNQQYWANNANDTLHSGKAFCQQKSQTAAMNIKEILSGNIGQIHSTKSKVKENDFDCLETLKSGEIKAFQDNIDLEDGNGVSTKKNFIKVSNTNTPNQSHAYSNFYNF